MNKEIIFSTQIREDEILLCLNKTYVTTYTDSYEFQRLWFYRSYKAFKDFGRFKVMIATASFMSILIFLFAGIIFSDVYIYY